MAEGRLTVVAHRGACLVAVENTPDTFQRALDLGSDVLETDVRSTRDGELVLLHDATLERIAGRSERVDQVTWAELSVIPVGPPEAGARVCRLAEVYPLLLDRVGTDKPGVAGQAGRARLLLDIKPPLTCATLLARSLVDSGIQERVILGVRSVNDLEAVRRELPQAQTLGFGATPDVEWALADAGVDIVRLRSTWLDDATLARARSFGRPVWVIGGGSGTAALIGGATLDELLSYRRLGLDGVLVNDPALAVQANAV